jgi:NADH dehydrogenase
VHRRPVDGADEKTSGDLRDHASIRRAGEGIDAVMHLAALTHSRDARGYFEANVEGTRTLLASLPPSISRFVYVSTRAISPSGGAYSRSKRDAEEVVRTSELPWVIVRLPEVFGAGSREGVDDILDRAKRGAPIPVVGWGDDIVCPLHIDDVVPALAAALSSSSAVGSTYTLAGECVSVRELATRSACAFNSRSRIVHVPVAAVRVLTAAARFLPLRLYPDQLARLRAPKPPATPEAEPDLGFRPRSLRDALSSLGR